MISYRRIRHLQLDPKGFRISVLSITGANAGEKYEEGHKQAHRFDAVATDYKMTI